MRKGITAIIAFSMLLATAPAHAQWVVVDPANLVQNIMSVISTLQQEITQAEQLANQNMQLEYDRRQLKGLDGGDVSGMFNTIPAALNSQQRYASSVRALYGDVGNAKTIATDLYGRMGASGLSQEEWMKREAAQNKARQEGNGYLTDYQANVFQQVGKRYEEVRNLQGRITTTEGTHESMQLMNSQMNVLLGTMNQMLEHNATLAQRDTSRDIESAGRAKASNDSYQAWLNGQKAAREASAKKIESMGNSAAGR